MRSYLLFHLNLSFSSVEESQHKLIIKKCYEPILKIANTFNQKVAIEASASTLDKINQINPKFVNSLKELIAANLVEFVGSGYVQSIGPMNSAYLNNLNLEYGNQVYKSLLGIVPETALINEMTFSYGILDSYLNNNFKRIIMDIDNTITGNLTKKINYHFNYLKSLNSQKIEIVWSDSILFQNFQRYVHGENMLDEYLDLIKRYIGLDIPYFPVYTNDAEVFNFRPGRFKTEGKLVHDEWEKIYSLIQYLSSEFKLDFVLPREININQDKKIAPKLTNASSPILVKKQAKYNFNRWAVTGRNDRSLNQLTRFLSKKLELSEIDYSQKNIEDILKLSSSDLRTHITNKRWNKLMSEIKRIIARNELVYQPNQNFLDSTEFKTIDESFKSEHISFKDSKYLNIKTDFVDLTLNLFKGMCISSLGFAKNQFIPFIRSTNAGYFDGIHLGADFFSGTLIGELPLNRRRLLDIVRVKNLYFDEDPEKLTLVTESSAEFFEFQKIIRISKIKNHISLEYRFKNIKKFIGIVRAFNFIINTSALNAMGFRAQIGGKLEDEFNFSSSFDHGSAVSSYVSSNGGFVTEDGRVEIFDKDNRGLMFQYDASSDFAVSMIRLQEASPSNFLRLAYSLRETDDTARESNILHSICVNISPI